MDYLGWVRWARRPSEEQASRRIQRPSSWRWERLGEDRVRLGREDRERLGRGEM